MGAAAADGEARDVVVVAPLANQSGARPRWARSMNVSRSGTGRAHRRRREHRRLRARRLPRPLDHRRFARRLRPQTRPHLLSITWRERRRSVLHSGTLVRADRCAARCERPSRLDALRRRSHPMGDGLATAVATHPGTGRGTPRHGPQPQSALGSAEGAEGIRRARSARRASSRPLRTLPIPLMMRTTGRVGGGPFESGSRQGEIRLRLGARCRRSATSRTRTPTTMPRSWPPATPRHSIVGVREETGPRADGLLEAAMRDVEQFLS